MADLSLLSKYPLLAFPIVSGILGLSCFTYKLYLFLEFLPSQIVYDFLVFTVESKSSSFSLRQFLFVLNPYSC